MNFDIKISCMCVCVCRGVDVGRETIKHTQNTIVPINHISSFCSKSNELKSVSLKYSSMRSRSTVFSNVSDDISKLVIGDVTLPRSNHSSSAARSYEKPSGDFAN